MKTTCHAFVAVLMLYSGTLFSQTNNFILGIYTGEGLTYDASGNIVTQAKVGGHYTSPMGIAAEDGFNTIFTYQPGSDFKFKELRAYLTLVKNNHLKVIDETPGFFKPYPNSPGGENQYNLDPIAGYPTNAKYNIDRDYDSVYSDPLFANTITGHSLGGEFSFFHSYAYKNLVPSWADNVNTTEWKKTEVPPQNLSDAILHFRQKQQSLPTPIFQNITYSCAVHGGTIEGFADTMGVFDEEDYVFMTGVTNPQKPDIFSEGSYFSNQFKDWHTNYNYLGKFKSIDFVSQHFSRVIAEVFMGQDDSIPQYEYVYHSNPTIRNANHLWFQAYTSIIHGATGVTFWGIGYAYKDTPDDLTNSTYINSSNPDRFDRVHAPEYYKYYVSNLGRELRYLIDEGFLSTDPSTVLYSKTGASSDDPNCILPKSDTYLPATILAADARDYLAVNHFSRYSDVNNIKRSEAYGLRYTIRTNGTDVIMIVSNPNPYSVHNVDFSFDYISNPVIRRANGVDVLFDDGSVTNVNSSSYKVENASTHKRSNSVDTNFDLLKMYHVAFAANEKGFTSDFGPFDVKVFRFTSTAAPTSTDWVKVWSNNGNKDIGGWSPVSPTDKFLIGDFDNNGKEDLLSLTSQTSSNWAVMQEYNVNTQSWDWKWANSGNNQLASDWPLSSSHRYYVGDFNGDSKSDILCVSGTNGWVNIYTYNNNSWVKMWSNNGNSNIGGWIGFQATDNFYVADFDGNGKANLLAMQASSASSGKWAVMQELNVEPGSWLWQWSNSGNNQLASDWPLNIAHKYYTGDYNGDGKAEIYCASGTNNYTNIYGYNNGFVWKWSNSGSPDNLSYSAGWPMPFKPNVEILSGNIDNDSKSELLFIDEDYYTPSSYSALRAQSADISSTTGKLTANWTNSSSTYINDWPLQGGNSSYYLIKASSTESNKYLLAMKDYASVSGCTSSDYLVSLYKVNNPTINYISINNQGEEEKPTEDFSFSVYPNPNNGMMTVRITSEIEGQAVLELYSVEGIRVASYKVDEENTPLGIDQSALIPGTYFFNLVSNNEILSRQKVIIVK